MKRTLLALFITTLATSSVSLAKNNKKSVSANNSTSITQAPKKENRIWSGFVYASRSTNLVDYNDGTRSDSMDYTARLNLVLNKNYFVRGQIGYSQDLNDNLRNDFTNGTVTLIRNPFEVHQRLMMNYRLGMVLPTSKNAYENQSLQTAVVAGGSLIINPRYLIKGLSIVGDLSFTHNFHQYNQAYSGNVNTKMSSTQRASLSYSFLDKLYLSADFLHANFWSYNNKMSDSFSLSQEIGYSPLSSFTLALGHSNSGNALKSNGYDSNVQFYNEASSLVYLSGLYAF